MSTFHVRAVLEKHPELRVILGRRRIARCDDAKYTRIDEDLLSSYGHPWSQQIFLVSNDGKLLGSLATGVLRAILYRKRVLEKVEQVGVENVAYIIHFSPGFTATVMNGGTSDNPCVITISYPPMGMTLEKLVRRTQEKARKDVVAS